MSPADPTLKTKRTQRANLRLKAKKTQTLIEKAKPKRKMKQFLNIRCPICFNLLGNGKKAVSSTGCGHVFCTGCLQKALQLKPTCPTCRKVLKGKYGYHPLYLDNNSTEDMDRLSVPT